MEFESKFKQERIKGVEEMLEKAESKVQFVKSLHDIVLSLDEENTIAIDSQQLYSVLKEKFNLHVEGDQELKAALEDLNSRGVLKAELIAERERFDQLSQQERTDEAVQKHKDFSKSKKSDIAKIDENPDVLYLKQVQDNIKYLVALKKERDEFKNLYEQDGGILLKEGKFVHVINDFINKRYSERRERMKKDNAGFKGYNLGRADYGKYLSGVEFRGLGVVLTFKESAGARLRAFNDIGGSHFGNSSISFVFENEDKERVTSHEYDHTLFGAHGSHKALYSEGLLKNIKKIVNPDPVAQLMRVVFAKDHSTEMELENNILGYQKELMGEIFADLESIFDQRIAYGFYTHFNNSMFELSKYTDGLKDEHIKEIIKKAQNELILSVEKYKAELAELVYLANQLDKVDDAMAGMLVFGGDARKALRHFKGIIGEEKVTSLLAEYDPNENRIYESPEENEGNKTV